jgi:MGT family glycosyltransferase
VRIVSCNPAEVKDPDVPPPFSGYPTADRSGWEDYWAEYRAAHADLHASFSAFCVERGAPPLPADEFIHESDWLNLYLYPDMVDYERARPLGPTWHNLRSSVRATDEAWEVPEALRDGPGRLVYLSLGSLGSGDVELMQGLVDAMADSGHRVIVSKGPQHEQIKLYDNMVGAEFLPQTSVLPHVDLVITHGGNNTVTESLYFGKPMVLLPLFWDQYDNAQRIHETGLGVRLDTYGHEPQELRAAVDRLLADEALHARLAAGARELQAVPGTVRAADLIEQL